MVFLGLKLCVYSMSWSCFCGWDFSGIGSLFGLQTISNTLFSLVIQKQVECLLLIETM